MMHPDATPAFHLLVGGMVLGTWIALVAGGRRLGRSSPHGLGAWIVWTGLLIAAVLAAARPYLGVDKVGAGDAYHYALQLEDVRTQAHAGVFPVLVGQSRFGFNGNVHTLRTAPLFVHLGLLLDRLSDGKLDSFALENAVALLCALGSAGAMGLVLLARGVTQPALVAGAAAIYATSAAVLGPLLGGDMYATFVAAPWIPLVLLGLARWWEHGARWVGSALPLIAWALVWYAHPPTAAMLTPVVLLVWLLRLTRERDRRRMLAGSAVALVAWAALCAYLFVSVGSMRLGYFAREQSLGAASVLSGLPSLWPGLVGAVSSAHRTVADFHPGWAVLALAAVGIARMRVRPVRPAWPALALGAYTLALLPGPSSWLLWHLVPDPVIAFVNPWPHQRIMPIVAALAVMWGAESLSAWTDAGRRRLWIAVAALAWGTVWNLAELRQFRPAIEAGRPQILPGNVVLTRSSYLLFAGRPDYFSDGPMEPEAETRLLDDSLRPLLTDAGELFRRTPEPSDWVAIGTERAFPLQPGRGCALEFRFAHPEATGEIALSSGPLRRVFALPKSGDRLAFGSSPAADHRLLLPAADLDGKTLWITSSVPGVSVRLRFYAEEELPIRVLGLIPFAVSVRSPEAGYLEMPKMALPGYTAEIHGRPVPVSRSPQGLAMVPIEAGESIVRLEYHPWYLRLAFWFSVASFAVVPVAFRLLGRARTRARAAQGLGRLVRRLRERRILVAIAAVAIGLAAAMAAVRGIRNRHWVRLTLVLPDPQPALAEPLLVLGRTGEADLIYLRYADATHLRVGYDHWGRGGPVSALIRHVPGEPVRVEIHSPGLPTRWPAFGADAGAASTEVIVDGRTVLSGELPCYPNSGREVAIGRNGIGASSCGDHFSGRIEVGARD
jgi:hypothetical protein